MIFVTGSTGFLGSQLLGRLLLAYPSEEIGVLVRSSSDHSARKRTLCILNEIFPKKLALQFSNRVITLEGDLTKPRLGLTQGEMSKVVGEVSKIFHCAAAVSFSQPIHEARLANVMSTQYVLDLAHHAQHNRGEDVPLHYVSTAYVVGDTERAVGPNEFCLDSRFKNTYEQTKAEAEFLVRSATNGIRSVIYRPSIIVGDSITGQTSSFNVIYGPARFLARGLLKVVPGSPSALFDMVPVDYVADAITNLSKMDLPSGSSFHLCSGIGAEATLVELLEYLFISINKTVSRKFSPPPFLTPELIALVQQSITMAFESMKSLEKFLGSRLEVLQKIIPYFLYMIRNPQFDISATTETLKGVMAPPPAFQSYAERLFDYCQDTNWGKLPWTNPHDIKPWFKRTSFQHCYL